jgi:hypothetical protein
MGRSYSKSKRHKHRERRRVRARNRKAKDEMEFVKVLEKQIPQVSKNASTIPNQFTTEDVVGIVEFVLAELGPGFGYTQLDINMQLEQKMNLAIDVLTNALVMVKGQSHVSLLCALKYIKDSKKQFVRRGAFGAFKGHGKNPTKEYVEEGDTKCEEEEEEVVSTKKPSKVVARLRKKVMQNRFQSLVSLVPPVPPLPTKEDLRPKSTYTVPVAKPHLSTILEQKEEDKEEEEDSMWACSIM